VTTASIKRGLAMRRTLLGKNPQIVLLAEIRYRDAPKTFLPAEGPPPTRSPPATGSSS